jgi:hypothetical protein
VIILVKQMGWGDYLCMIERHKKQAEYRDNSGPSNMDYQDKLEMSKTAYYRASPKKKIAYAESLRNKILRDYI